jgi:hypothetical protein
MSTNPSTQRCRSTSSPTEAPMTKNQRRLLTPKSLFHGLARELDLLAPVYARLHLAHSALRPYATLAVLLERLTKGPRDDAKSELLAALIAIRQRTPHRLWVAILLRAFRPMLAKLWKELFGSDSQERLALLLLGFQGAICHIDPWRDPIRLGMYVRQATRRRAIAALTHEVRWNDVGFGEDADEVVDVRASEPPVRDRLRAAQRLLLPGELSAHVRRLHPGLSLDEQTRLYRKLRRGLERVLLEVPPTDGARGKEVML